MKNKEEKHDPFEKLKSYIGSYEELVKHEIYEAANKNNYDEINNLVDKAKKIKVYQEKVEIMKKEFQNLLAEEENMKELKNDHSQENNNPPLGRVGSSQGISWRIEGDIIRIGLDKENEMASTSNLIPLPLFKKIVSCVLKIIDSKRYVKTSDILKEMENEIKIESDYKKTPRVPVSMTFKVLVDQNLLRQYAERSHRYILNSEKSKVLKWLEKL